MILFHGDRHPDVCAEVMSIWSADKVVVLNGAGGGWIKGAIKHKVITAALFKNKLHLKLVTEHIKQWLIERIQDPNDSRFYREYGPKPSESDNEKSKPAPTTPPPRHVDHEASPLASSHIRSDKSPGQATESTMDEASMFDMNV